MAKKAGKRFNLPDELNKSMVTPKFRCSYEHLVEPWSGDEDKDPRYSVQMIFPKDDPFIGKAKRYVKKIAIEAFGPNAVKLLRSGKLHNPFRDGDDEFPDDETYANGVFVNANGSFVGKKPTGLYDQRRRDIRKMDNPEEIVYSGCYARAEIKFFPYDREGGKGVACYLFRVQKMADGEPLGGGRPVEDVFDEIEVDDDDVIDMGDDDDEDF
jgi:hypothetical protein